MTEAAKRGEQWRMMFETRVRKADLPIRGVHRTWHTPLPAVFAASANTFLNVTLPTFIHPTSCFSIFNLITPF
jgi:hypothetical protein